MLRKLASERAVLTKRAEENLRRCGFAQSCAKEIYLSSAWPARAHTEKKVLKPAITAGGAVCSVQRDATFLRSCSQKDLRGHMFAQLIIALSAAIGALARRSLNSFTLHFFMPGPATDPQRAWCNSATGWCGACPIRVAQRQCRAATCCGRTAY